MERFEIDSINRTPKGPRNGSKWVTVVVACVVCLVMGGIGGAYISGLVEYASPEATSSPIISSTPVLTPDNTPSASTSDKVFTQDVNTTTLSPAQIYEQSIESIVGITTEGTTTNAFGYQSEFAATGTGFVVGKEGYIVTNYHVVEGGKKFTVSFFDSTIYEATLVGAEEENDLAVLKIEGDEFKEILVGDSDDLVVGQDVVVIGNPLGELTYTMTRGILSALDRRINITGTAISMFQIDAAVNSGNSGGPVIDAAGNVIGVVTAKPNSSTVDGIGFCIPINDVKAIVSDIIEYGYVTGKPHVGITGFIITQQMSKYYRVPEGFFVQTVEVNSTAAIAGIEAGDVIKMFDGVEIKSVESFKSIIAKKSVGDVVSVVFIRSDVEMTVSLAIGEYTGDIPDVNDSTNT